MEYWTGYMNWPVVEGWVCETCGLNVGLTWGFVHAQARCNACHTEYRMRDAERNIVDVPICQLKETFQEPARQLWQRSRTPIDEATDREWIACGVPEAEVRPPRA